MFRSASSARLKAGGGILEEIIHQIDVRCDPANIPDHIDVEVTALTIGHSLHVSDLKLPEGVEVMADAEQTVAIVSAPKAEEAPAVVAEGAVVAPEGAPEPELIRKPKAGEEGEETET